MQFFFSFEYWYQIFNGFYREIEKWTFFICLIVFIFLVGNKIIYQGIYIFFITFVFSKDDINLYLSFCYLKC